MSKPIVFKFLDKNHLIIKLNGPLQRQLTNSFVTSQPMTKDEQEQYCKANHMTYNRDHMIVFLIRLMDTFLGGTWNFLTIDFTN